MILVFQEICGYSRGFFGEGALDDSGVVDDGNFQRPLDHESDTLTTTPPSHQRKTCVLLWFKCERNHAVKRQAFNKKTPFETLKQNVGVDNRHQYQTPNLSLEEQGT